MLEYLVDDVRYTLHYSELREDYLRYQAMSDEDFIANLAQILHFACVTCFLKEAPTYVVLSDRGVIHELVHLIDPATKHDTYDELPRIREAFNTWCCLA